MHKNTKNNALSCMLLPYRTNCLLCLFLLLVLVAKPALAEESDLPEAPLTEETLPTNEPNPIIGESLPVMRLHPPTTPLVCHTTEQTPRIAALLPLSGAWQAIGNILLQSMLLAYENTATTPTISLNFYDTKSSEEGARSAFLHATSEGASLVIGPVFADHTQAISAMAEHTKTMTFSLSNISSNTTDNPYIFNFGIRPEHALETLASAAIFHGKTHFLAALPDTPEGLRYHTTLSAILKAKQHRLAHTIWYGVDHYNMSETLAAFDAILEQNQNDPSFPAHAALFVPSASTQTLSLLKQLESHHKLKGMQILGSGEWDTMYTKQDPWFTNLWFASTDPALQQHFHTLFLERYGVAPLRIASIAYDATAMAVALLTQQEALLPSSLYHKRFEGFNGVFAFQDNGQAAYHLTTLKMTGKTPQKVTTKSSQAPDVTPIGPLP